MTNLEKIRKMSSSEIEYYINWMCDNSSTCEMCPMYAAFCKENNEIYFPDRKRFADWLNEEVKE